MPQSYSNSQQNLSFTTFDKQSEVTVFNTVNSLKISSSHSSLAQELVVPNPDSEFDIIDSLDYDDDDDAVFDQEIVYQRRELLIQELYQTEKDYVKNVLQALQSVYILPLRKNTKQSSFSFLGMKKPPCTEREIFWLFGNLEELLEVHKSILNDLEERFSIWGPTQIMSDIILTWFPKMQKIYRVYLDHYSITVSTFERLSRYQPFKKFLESVEKDSEKGRDLLSLLRVPNTCILRYAKILTSLADNTSSMHPDYVGLLQCKQRVEQLFEEFRHNIADTKNINEVYEIHCSMTDQPFGITADRRLYLQGDFIQLNKSGGGEERAYFLFSDMLVYAKRKKFGLQYKGHIQLERAQVREISKEEADGNNDCIEIVSSFQGVDSLNTTFMASPTAHVMKIADKDDLSKWKACLEAVIAKNEKAAQSKMNVSHNVQSTSTGSLKKPVTTASSTSSGSISF